MTLTWMHTGKLQTELAWMFASNHTAILDAIIEWMPKYGNISLMLGILPFIDKDLVDALEPERFISSFIQSALFLTVKIGQARRHTKIGLL